MKKQLTEGETPDKMPLSPSASGTLQECWEAACVQSLQKLLAGVWKLGTSGPCSGVGWTDWIYIKNGLVDVVRTKT